MKDSIAGTPLLAKTKENSFSTTYKHILHVRYRYMFWVRRPHPYKGLEGQHLFGVRRPNPYKGLEGQHLFGVRRPNPYEGLEDQHIFWGEETSPLQKDLNASTSLG